MWAPEREIVCPGGLWVGVLPHCGNPQKVQRHPEEWADALEAIASVEAELMLPGHGHPVEGAKRIRTWCLNTAEALRAIVRQTLEGLNAGRTHEDILASIRIPEHLAAERSRQRRHQSSNVYSLEEAGVSETDLTRELGPILERFGFRPEDVPRDRTTEVL